MIRTKLWFRCAVMHDPVTPTIEKPAVISWEAKNRKVDLAIERAFKSDELVMRVKGAGRSDSNRGTGDQDGWLVFRCLGHQSPCRSFRCLCLRSLIC